MDEPAILADRLAALCAERGWSYRQASQRAGLGNNWLGNYISQPMSRPQKRTLTKLAEAFGVDEAYLLGITDERHARHDVRRLMAADFEEKGLALIGPCLRQTVRGERGIEAYRIEGQRGASRDIPPGSVVLIDTARAPASGDTVLVRDRAGSMRIAYFAEPYAVFAGASGQGHGIIGAGLEVLGVVRMCITTYERYP